MTSGGLTRPGERDRLIVKFTEIDWTFCLILCLIAGAGGMMMFSAAEASWMPWAWPHLMRFGVVFVAMIILAMVDLRVWFALAYPAYVGALILLVGVEVMGESAKGAQRWLEIGPLRFQPSEIMKIAIVLALARFYHGISADSARMSWWLLIPLLLIGAPTLLVAHQPDLGTALLIAATGLRSWCWRDCPGGSSRRG